MAGVKYTACSGPDKEGRYLIKMEYSEPFDETSRIYVKNETWRSEHGSHFNEDHRDETGRLVARRSGVLTPVDRPE